MQAGLKGWRRFRGRFRARMRVWICQIVLSFRRGGVRRDRMRGVRRSGCGRCEGERRLAGARLCRSRVSHFESRDALLVQRWDLMLETFFLIPADGGAEVGCWARLSRTAKRRESWEITIQDEKRSGSKRNPPRRQLMPSQQGSFAGGGCSVVVLRRGQRQLGALTTR